MRKLLLIFPVALIPAFFLGSSLLTRKSSIPTTQARRGELVVSIIANGTVDARRAHTIVAPRVRNIQITWLEKEGTMVQAGAPLVRFDSSQQQAEVNDNESGLKIAETALHRARQEYTIQEKQLTLELQRAQRNFDEMKHEAPKVAEEAKLELEVAELNIQAKLDQIRSDTLKAALEVQRARDKLAMARKDLAQLTIAAPIPGMVVYLEIWKGSTSGKVQEGDSPWPGQGLINLPDLSEMIVKAPVSEVDAGKVSPGQEVVITLDASPDLRYQGTVLSKGTLARHKDETSKINVFDVEITILDKDESLKPGMSASARIVVEKVPDAVCLPIEAVFERDGKPVVYLQNKRPRPIEVGKRSDIEVQVTSGLQPGEVVCLVDPSRPPLPGEKAVEPELNKGRIIQPESGPAGSGR